MAPAYTARTSRAASDTDSRRARAAAIVAFLGWRYACKRSRKRSSRRRHRLYGARSFAVKHPTRRERFIVGSFVMMLALVLASCGPGQDADPKTTVELRSPLGPVAPEPQRPGSP